MEFSKGGKSVFPAILKPHPGQSYNPAPAEHSNLLTSIADKAIKDMEKEEEEKRKRDPFRE